jgi:hypothetical protein
MLRKRLHGPRRWPGTHCDTGQLWNLPPATAAATMCATTGQPLTQAE